MWLLFFKKIHDSLTPSKGTKKTIFFISLSLSLSLPTCPTLARTSLEIALPKRLLNGFTIQQRPKRPLLFSHDFGLSGGDGKQPLTSGFKAGLPNIVGRLQTMA